MKDPLPIGVIIANANPDLNLDKSDWKELNGQTLNGAEFNPLHDLTGWGDDNAVKLPDLRGRTIFYLSPVDNNKNIDPIFSKQVELNQQFGILAPQAHFHDANTSACPDNNFTSYGCVGQQNQDMHQSGKTSQDFATEATEYKSSEVGIDGNDAQKEIGRAHV